MPGKESLIKLRGNTVSLSISEGKRKAETRFVKSLCNLYPIISKDTLSKNSNKQTLTFYWSISVKQKN